MQRLNQEKVLLERAVGDYNDLHQRVEDGLTLLDMALEAEDESSFQEVRADLANINARLGEGNTPTL